MGKENQSFIPAHELEGIRERGIKRAERRVEEREHLRLEIQSRKHILEMEAAAFILYEGYEPIADRDTGEMTLRPIGRDRVASLKAAADISEKLLRKVLPDLKQVEIQTDSNGGEGRILENTDLSNRMRLYMEAIQQRTINPPIEDAVIVEEVDFLA